MLTTTPENCVLLILFRQIRLFKLWAIFSGDTLMDHKNVGYNLASTSYSIDFFSNFRSIRLILDRKLPELKRFLNTAL